jgi:hypothetical protein
MTGEALRLDRREVDPKDGVDHRRRDEIREEQTVLIGHVHDAGAAPDPAVTDATENGWSGAAGSSSPFIPTGWDSRAPSVWGGSGVKAELAVSAVATDIRWRIRQSEGDRRGLRAALLRAANSVRGELVLLLGPLVSQLRIRRGRALPVTAILLLVMLSFKLVPIHGRMGSVMRSVSAVSADLPWWQAALRLPGSIFAPASNLPIWGAFAQVAVVAATAESLIGWRRMLLVCIVANAAATAGARVMAWLGPGCPVGISADIASQPDTGPSVFVTAVLIYLCIVHRTPIVGRLTALTMISEVAINPNLPGREHLIGMATAAILAGAAHFRYPGPPSSRRGSSQRQWARCDPFVSAATIRPREQPGGRTNSGGRDEHAEQIQPSCVPQSVARTWVDFTSVPPSGWHPQVNAGQREPGLEAAVLVDIDPPPGPALVQQRGPQREPRSGSTARITPR